MRSFLVLYLLLSGWSAGAESLLLDSYFTSVRQQARFVIYSHEVFDVNRVPRFVLWKTVKPIIKDGRHSEEIVYAVGVKNSEGEILNEEFISPEKYLELRKIIETAKEYTLLINWAHGCNLTLTTKSDNTLVNLTSQCPQNKNPAIEAGPAE